MKTMRKRNRKIKEMAEVEAILKECRVCRLAMSKDNQPYVIPVNYGYENMVIFIHTGKEGMKMDFLKENDKVCIEVDRNCNLIAADSACKFSYAYESVVAFGEVSIIDEPAGKRKALDIIMKHQTGTGGWEYNKPILDMVRLLQIPLHHVTGKRSLPIR
ncbi:MAG: pyridoxamine 5'-phosphate oxidase family protein [Promethearchaeota archaeon]